MPATTDAISCCGGGSACVSSTETNPVVIGQPNGAPAVHVHATIAVGRLRRRCTAWVTGTEAAALIPQSLVPL